MDPHYPVDLGPHLTEVILALVGAVASIITGYFAYRNHTILKNGASTDGGPTDSQPNPTTSEPGKTVGPGQ